MNRGEEYRLISQRQARIAELLARSYKKKKSNIHFLFPGGDSKIMQTNEQHCDRQPYKIISGQRGNTISFYLRDCISGMNESLQEKSVDVVVTSPPYNIGVNYSSYQDELPRERYLQWMEEVGIAIKRVLRDNGSYFLNIGNKPTDQWIAWDVANVLRKYFVLQNTIHWIKSIAIKKSDIGNYPIII